MKKILIFVFAIFMSLSIFGRSSVQDTLNRANRYDADTLVRDTVYYNVDPFFYTNLVGRFYHNGFNYWMYDDPWYYDSFYFGYNYPFWSYPYPFWGFYWGFGYNPWFNNYWGYNPWFNNYWGYGFGGGRYRWSNPHRGYSSSRYIDGPGYPKNKINGTSSQTARSLPQNKPVYSRTNRSYSPAYQQPRMNARPVYNNARARNSYSRSIQNARTGQSHSYSQASRSYSSGNYSSGSRMSSSSSYSRGSYSSVGSSSRRR
jgi:hypothetical protein